MVILRGIVRFELNSISGYSPQTIVVLTAVLVPENPMFIVNELRIVGVHEHPQGILPSHVFPDLQLLPEFAVGRIVSEDATMLSGGCISQNRDLAWLGFAEHST